MSALKIESVKKIVRFFKILKKMVIYNENIGEHNYVLSQLIFGMQGTDQEGGEILAKVKAKFCE